MYSSNDDEKMKAGIAVKTNKSAMEEFLSQFSFTIDTLEEFSSQVRGKLNMIKPYDEVVQESLDQPKEVTCILDEYNRLLGRLFGVSRRIELCARQLDQII